MPTAGKTIAKVAAWVVLFIAVGVVTVVFWLPLGLALLLGIMVVGIIAVLRDLIRELRGQRPTYTAGSVKLSDIPRKPRRFWHFRTRFPPENHDEE